MKCWIFLATTFITSVTSDRYNLLHFSLSNSELYECIKNHYSLNAVRSENNVEIVNELAKYCSGEIFMRTVSVEFVNTKVVQIVDEYVEDGDIVFNNQRLRTQFEKAYQKAILDCSDDYRRSNSSEPNSQTRLISLISSKKDQKLAFL